MVRTYHYECPTCRSTASINIENGRTESIKTIPCVFQGCPDQKVLVEVSEKK